MLGLVTEEIAGEISRVFEMSFETNPDGSF